MRKKRLCSQLPLEIGQLLPERFDLLRGTFAKFRDFGPKGGKFCFPGRFFVVRLRARGDGSGRRGGRFFGPRGSDGARRRRFVFRSGRGMSAGVLGFYLRQFLRLVKVVGDDRAPARGRKINQQSFLLQAIDDRHKLADVADRFHASGAAAKLAHGLGAAKQQLGHHRQLGFVYAEPVVEEVAVFFDAAVTLNERDGAGAAESVEGLVDRRLVELHERKAIAFLIAAIDERVGGERIGVGRGFGLLGKDAGDATFDSLERAPTGGGGFGRIVGHVCRVQAMCL